MNEAHGVGVGILEIAGLTSSTPQSPETPIQLPQGGETEEEDRSILFHSDKDQDNEDDSGYCTGRKRIRISVNKYKSRRPTLNAQSNQGDHLAFDRISPNSKFYKTPFVPSEKPVNRVLFPRFGRKNANTQNNYKEPEKIPPTETYDTNENLSEPEPPEKEKEENIYDPLSPYRHTWTDSNLMVLYVLRRW
ncbi:hypothetical protein TWF481_000637 [Arthrobotrys musiformis]|uniref:Uncharacterized protein n=1 Tax=Arthrobotrys musiformis TaxID=47236 RepID=A0AAV9WNB5_9PEZI